MKWLAALLVVLNVGAFIWGGWYKDAPEQVSRPRPALHADKMRLLSEPGVTRVPRAPTPAPSAPAPKEEAAATGAVCFAIGPFPTAVAATKAGAQLDRLQLGYAVRAERVPVASAWQVLLPPLAPKAKAEAKRRELTQRGITDHYLILEGRNKGAISLGVFSTPEAAKKQLEHLNQQGLTAQIDTLYRRRAQFWLEGGVPATAAQAWTSVEGLQWEVRDVRVSQGPCPAGPGEQAVQAAPTPAP